MEVRAVSWPKPSVEVTCVDIVKPLSDVFSATPRARQSPFRQLNFERPAPTFTVAEDKPVATEEEGVVSATNAQTQSKSVVSIVDSGYHGSQAVDDTTQLIEQNEHGSETQIEIPLEEPAPKPTEEPSSRDSEERRTTEGSFQSAKEEQIRRTTQEQVTEERLEEPVQPDPTVEPVAESSMHLETAGEEQPRSPPSAPAATEPSENADQTIADGAMELDEEQIDEVHSPSDGSSPVRPIVRKSSLNFASLPAREPLTTKKSIGNRASRTSHLDQPRTSYYPRQTGGKSLGNAKTDAENEHDDMDIDNEGHIRDGADSKITQLHNKTSTQRLQDQISMLGQSQAATRPIPKNLTAVGVAASSVSQPNHAALAWEVRYGASPQRKDRGQTPLAPGAFPEDEDSWIGPATVAPAERSLFSPRPQLLKTHTADSIGDMRGKTNAEGAEFNLPKRNGEARQNSPLRATVATGQIPSTLGHIKSASTSVLRSPSKIDDAADLGHKKAVSVSNPQPPTASETATSTTPPKSPSRTYKGSPLKAAKDKFSSILKTSRGLFASSAAISADAKSAALSTPSTIFNAKAGPSLEEVLQLETKSSGESLYPDLDAKLKTQHQQDADGLERTNTRKTRASAEKEERRREEEAKEAQKIEDQLEKARQRVREEARIHHLEQERVATMQKQILARKEQEKQEKQVKETQPETQRATRSSPRKAKAQQEEEENTAALTNSQEPLDKDTEMADSSSMPPPAVPRSKPASQVSRPGAKRPLRPAKEQSTKAKPPTVIRVDTGSQRGHQYHPSTTTLAASLQDTLSAPSTGAQTQGTLKGKASTSSIQSKASTSSFKSSATKALEAAARKKEQVFTASRCSIPYLLTHF